MAGAVAATVVALVVVLSFAGAGVAVDGSSVAAARAGTSDTAVEPWSGTQPVNAETTDGSAVRSVSVAAAGPWDSAGVTGRVTGEDGDPIFNATVAVEGSNRKTTTAGDGYYSLELTAGTHRIVILADGYQRETATVNVSSDEWYNST